MSVLMMLPRRTITVIAQHFRGIRKENAENNRLKLEILPKGIDILYMMYYTASVV